MRMFFLDGDINASVHSASLYTPLLFLYFSIVVCKDFRPEKKQLDFDFDY
jgi:hypothetical protein